MYMRMIKLSAAKILTFSCKTENIIILLWYNVFACHEPKSIALCRVPAQAHTMYNIVFVYTFIMDSTGISYL